MKVLANRSALETILTALVTVAGIGWAISYCFTLNGYNLALQDASTALFVGCCVIETFRALGKQRTKK